jgi:hypothetical protein
VQGDRAAGGGADMKFGKRLIGEATRCEQWRAFYCDYKACKKALKDDIRNSGKGARGRWMPWAGSIGVGSRRRARAPAGAAAPASGSSRAPHQMRRGD